MVVAQCLLVRLKSRADNSFIILRVCGWCSVCVVGWRCLSHITLCWLCNQYQGEVEEISLMKPKADEKNTQPPQPLTNSNLLLCYFVTCYIFKKPTG